MPPDVTCSGCGAPIPLARAYAGGSCPYCGATILPHAVPTPPARSTPSVPSPMSDALASVVVLLVRSAPFVAGLAAGMLGWAWGPDGVRLYVPPVVGMAGVSVLLVRSRGAVIAPSLYAMALGAWTAARPILRPIPTGYGGTFSPTSETALNWILPGVLLAVLGAGLIGHLGGPRLRAHAASARPHGAGLVGFALGGVLGFIGAADLASMTRIAGL